MIASLDLDAYQLCAFGGLTVAGVVMFWRSAFRTWGDSPEPGLFFVSFLSLTISLSFLFTVIRAIHTHEVPCGPGCQERFLERNPIAFLVYVYLFYLFAVCMFASFISALARLIRLLRGRA